MSIADKLTQIAENEQAVFDAGKKSEYDTFWDSYQENGNKVAYRLAFFGSGWNDTTFHPKYPIKMYKGQQQKMCIRDRAEKEVAKKAIDEIEKESEVTINAVKELFFGSFTEALEEAGLVVPDGFFDVGEESAEEFENGFSGSIEEAYQKIKERFNFDVVGGLAVIGDGATTTYSTFAPVYNLSLIHI